MHIRVLDEGSFYPDLLGGSQPYQTRAVIGFVHNCLTNIAACQPRKGTNGNAGFAQLKHPQDAQALKGRKIVLGGSPGLGKTYLAIEKLGIKVIQGEAQHIPS